MKVSIIIPAYNEEGVIADCLESLSRQSYRDMEIIVVDDGSKDSSKIKIQNAKLQFKIKNLKLLGQDHKGPGSARNLGVRHATGEILVFVDSDMTFDKDFIKNLITPIIKREAIGTFSKDEHLLNKDNIWARLWNLNRGLPEDRMHSDVYPDRQKVFRAILKEKFQKVGGFSERAGYTDDWTLSEKLGVEALSAPGAVFYHRNPGTLKEVFVQSKWMVKRRYRLGTIGVLLSLLRVSLPISLLIAISRSIRFGAPAFLVFKVVADLGAFLGLLEYSLLGNPAK